MQKKTKKKLPSALRFSANGGRVFFAAESKLISGRTIFGSLKFETLVIGCSS